MKSKLLSVMLVFIFCGVRLFAQKKDTLPKPVKTGNEWHMPTEAIKRSHDFANLLKKDLTLDDATTKKVFDIHFGNTKSVDEIRMGPGSENAKAQAMKGNKEALKAKLKTVLSPEQYDKFMKIGDDKKI
ncbi:hypothetical protein ACX0G9_21720 [Flavitalea flava]